MASDFMTIPEVAEMLRIAERTAYELARQGRIPGAAKVGGQWRLSRKDLDEWMAKGGEAASRSKAKARKRV